MRVWADLAAASQAWLSYPSSPDPKPAAANSPLNQTSRLLRCCVCVSALGCGSLCPPASSKRRQMDGLCDSEALILKVSEQVARPCKDHRPRKSGRAAGIRRGTAELPVINHRQRPSPVVAPQRDNLSRIWWLLPLIKRRSHLKVRSESRPRFIDMNIISRVAAAKARK